MKERKQPKKKVVKFIALLILVMMLLLIFIFLANYLYPDWRETFKIPNPFRSGNQTTVINQNITQTTNVYTNQWGFWKFATGLGGVIVILAVVVAGFYYMNKKSMVFFKHSPEECQKISFQKLKNNPNYNIEFEGMNGEFNKEGNGTWFPPLCYNLKDDVRSARVTSWFCTKKVEQNYNDDLVKEELWLVDCSQADPKNKFFAIKNITRREWVKFLHLLTTQQPFARFDAYKLETMLPLLAEEYFRTGQLENIKEMGKEGI